MKIVALILLSFVLAAIFSASTVSNQPGFNARLLGGWVLLSATTVGLYLLLLA